MKTVQDGCVFTVFIVAHEPMVEGRREATTKGHAFANELRRCVYLRWRGKRGEVK